LVTTSRLDDQTRRASLEQMQSRELDLLIVGGGITGVGAALDAASRGLAVGLIEQQDLASGTSSKSSKLIHGGSATSNSWTSAWCVRGSMNGGCS
jgi:glycerol-3-phosphate dehydrogenase